jgi:hypothetical protein
VTETDLELPGGRTLHVYDTAGQGGEDRLPVLWHHGTPNLGALPEPLLPLGVPVLLLHGGQDRVAPSIHARWLAGAIPSAELCSARRTATSRSPPPPPLPSAGSASALQGTTVLGGERHEGSRRLTCALVGSGRRESNPHRELGKLPRAAPYRLILLLGGHTHGPWLSVADRRRPVRRARRGTAGEVSWRARGGDGFQVGQRVRNVLGDQQPRRQAAKGRSSPPADQRSAQDSRIDPGH